MGALRGLLKRSVCPRQEFERKPQTPENTKFMRFARLNSGVLLTRAKINASATGLQAL
jgi:hypothetical protein